MSGAWPLLFFCGFSPGSKLALFHFPLGSLLLFLPALRLHRPLTHGPGNLSATRASAAVSIWRRALMGVVNQRVNLLLVWMRADNQLFTRPPLLSI